MALVGEPEGLRISMGPLVAPGGIVKVTLDALTAVGTVTTWPIRTPTVPVRSVPVIATGVPIGPLPGEKLVIAGGGAIVSVPVLVAVPPGVVTPRLRRRSRPSRP